MKIEEFLKNIGLNEVEGKVYLATLELGSSTVLPISKKSGIKRTYCYDILDSLQKRGLVSFVERNGRRRYSAEDPKRIKEQMEARMSQFNEVLPQLRSIYNSSVEKAAIRFYEGKDEIKNIYEMLPRAKWLDSIGSPDYMYGYLGQYFADIAARVSKNKVQVRELVPQKNADAPYIQNFKPPHEEVRFLPEGSKLATDLMIFDDKLALISYGKDIHGVLIESSSIVETQRYMFDLIWNMAIKAGDIERKGQSSQAANPNS